MAKLWRTPLAALLLTIAGVASGCAADQSDDYAVNGADESSKDDITNVKQSKVKRQSIGNCWIYATASWYESLHKSATNQEKNTSESWMTYWHWFEQIANGEIDSEIETGGTYGTAADLLVRYGLMLEGDFISSEANDEMSNQQKKALDAINLSLKSGVLSDAKVRRDRGAVRAELDRAWGLDAKQIARIDAVFGKKVERTLDRSTSANNATKANSVIRPQDFAVRLKDPQTKQLTNSSLGDALGRSGGFFDPRVGKLAFNEATYPTSARDRREFWKRVQRALHDEFPVLTSWKVDFNALTRDSRFSLAELKKKGAGKQGGHMTVMHDYQAEVPGLGLLAAGKSATKTQMDAALADGTKIQFVRIKNSWGAIRPDRWDSAAIMGFHDMEMDYLNGPIAECGEDGTDPKNCTGETVTPLWDVVLPAGY